MENNATTILLLLAVTIYRNAPIAAGSALSMTDSMKFAGIHGNLAETDPMREKFNLMLQTTPNIEFTTTDEAKVERSLFILRNAKLHGKGQLPIAVAMRLAGCPNKDTNGIGIGNTYLYARVKRALRRDNAKVDTTRHVPVLKQKLQANHSEEEDDDVDDALVDRFDQELERAFTSSKRFKSQHSPLKEHDLSPGATMESFWNDLERKVERARLLKRLVDPSDPLTLEQLAPEASELLVSKLRPENAFRPAYEEYEMSFPLSVDGLLNFTLRADQGTGTNTLFGGYNACAPTDVIALLNNIIHPEQGQLQVPKVGDRLVGIGIDKNIANGTKLTDVLVSLAEERKKAIEKNQHVVMLRFRSPVATYEAV